MAKIQRLNSYIVVNFSEVLYRPVIFPPLIGCQFHIFFKEFGKIGWVVSQCDGYLQVIDVPVKQHKVLTGDFLASADLLNISIRHYYFLTNLQRKCGKSI